VSAELLTPFGLRTLSPFDPAYRACYGGDPIERDGAYHQGTVWPWLLGSYVDAFLRVYGADEAARQVPAMLGLLAAHLRDYGLGGIAEVFDGEPPHRPNGCPWQAWSVAELLRVLAAASVTRG
jgi:glycogen debranching enzyme